MEHESLCLMFSLQASSNNAPTHSWMFHITHNSHKSKKFKRISSTHQHLLKDKIWNLHQSFPSLWLYRHPSLESQHTNPRPTDFAADHQKIKLWTSSLRRTISRNRHWMRKIPWLTLLIVRVVLETDAWILQESAPAWCNALSIRANLLVVARTKHALLTFVVAAMQFARKSANSRMRMVILLLYK